jgi:hypothetical protein
MAITKDITVAQGANHVEVFTIEVLTNNTLPFDATTNPYIPLDLTVATIQMQVRQSYNTSSVIMTATDLNGRIVKTDAPNGTFELRISPTDLDLVKGNSSEVHYLYDMMISLSASNTIKVADGAFTVIRQITRI